MRISFDVDDTLVLPGRRRGLMERFRPGTFELFRELRRRGHEVWIYTTSLRSPFALRMRFALGGVWIGGVVNAARHAAFARGPDSTPSKLPSAFGIDLHVDDSEGVRLEGDTHGFRVLIVAPDDPAWGQRVLEALRELRR